MTTPTNIPRRNMKSVVIYYQTTPSPHHQRVTCGKATFYIRTEVVGADTVHALDKAKPRPGETVLNSVELT